MYFGHGVRRRGGRATLLRQAREGRHARGGRAHRGILQGNVRQSPYVNMDAALRRRNYALDRMAAAGFITARTPRAAKQKPIEVRGEPNQTPSIAPYFLEEVRKHLERYGVEALYEHGLTVQTSLDPRLQRAANALDEGLRRLDKRRGCGPSSGATSSPRIPLEKHREARWDRPIVEGDVVPSDCDRRRADTHRNPGGQTHRADRSRGLCLDVTPPGRSGYAW